MILSDRSIREEIRAGRIEIEPFDETSVQPARSDQLVEVEGGEPFILHPGELVLGSTLERVRIPNDMVARLEGKSSLRRLGPLIIGQISFFRLTTPAERPYGWMETRSKYQGAARSDRESVLRGVRGRVNGRRGRLAGSRRPVG